MLPWTAIVTSLRDILGRREHEEKRASQLPYAGDVDPRDSALRGMLWSAPLAILVLVSLYVLYEGGRFRAVFKLLGPLGAVVLVPLLVHGTQFITNVRFWDLSDRWDELAGWQRGVLGTSIVLLAGLMILALAFSVGLHLEMELARD